MPGATLRFSRRASITLAVDGNVVVEGVLTMAPYSSGHTHRLQFPSIDESRFQGGGMQPLESDVGLWVTACGRVNLNGSRKTPWVRASEDLSAGGTTLRLAAAPTGWRVGDELVVTPTEAPVDAGHFSHFDEVRIRSISGNLVTLTAPLQHTHPLVDVGDGRVVGAEVLNLTRNVQVEGTPDGRTHTWIHSCCGTSSVRFASFRHFGPRQRDGDFTKDVLGRYGLHIHMTEDCSRGMLVEGAVARDGGSHAFVPHLAHGVTMRSCISYNTLETPFWWDQAASTRDEGPPSHDLLLDSCVAARVNADPAFRGQRLSGFMLGAGNGSIARDCVAVGVAGNKSANGFHWPELSHGVWEFQNCVAHNNKVHGIFVWQNNKDTHIVERFVAYHNGGSGISHGAYINAFVFRDSILYGNRTAGVEMHATSRAPGLTLDNLRIDGAGIGSHGVSFHRHNLPASETTSVRNCSFKGLRAEGIAFVYTWSNGPSDADLVDVVDCTWEGNEFRVGTGVTPDSVIRVSDASHGSLMLHRPTAGAAVREDWQAVVTPIDEFATHSGRTDTGIVVAALARLT